MIDADSHLPSALWKKSSWTVFVIAFMLLNHFSGRLSRLFFNL